MGWRVVVKHLLNASHLVALSIREVCQIFVSYSVARRLRPGEAKCYVGSMSFLYMLGLIKGFSELQFVLFFDILYCRRSCSNVNHPDIFVHTHVQ